MIVATVTIAIAIFIVLPTGLSSVPLAMKKNPSFYVILTPVRALHTLLEHVC